MKVYFLLLSSLGLLSIQAQVFSFESKEDSNTITHRVLMDDTYFVETLYRSDSANFILTRGGFYTIKGNTIQVNFEFNSNFEKDGLKQMDFKKKKDWKKISSSPKDLNGKWLMAGRMTPEGERRRDTSGPRKTMKFLLEGFFQWIAFNTETFQFFGSGGGTYTAKDGNYVESIVYFSRDDSKSGAVLPFVYELKGPDWYHKGLNSRGEPMHEIWTQRKN